MKIRASFAGLLAVLLLAGCQQPNTTSTGSQTGSQSTLDSAAYSIFLANGSVYVAGQYWNGSVWQSCYWKDGVLVHAHGTVALSVYVDTNSNVYLGGESNGFPMYLINTTLFLPDLAVYPDGITGEVRSIIAPGGSVSAVGNDHNGTGQHSYYPWEGVIFGPTFANTVNGSVAGSANSVFISSGNAYVVGQYYDGTNWLPYYWISPPNAATVLPGGVGDAYSVYVVSGTVYTSGQIFNGRFWVPCFWTGTTITRLLGDGIHNSSANGIFVDSGTVYTAGEYYDGSNWTPCYWAGATRTDLPGASTDTFVGSIFVLSGTVYAAGYYYDGTKFVACYWTGTTKTDLPGITVTKSINSEAFSRSGVAKERPTVGEALQLETGAANSRRPE